MKIARPSASGMTLIELLVAFIVLLMLVAALVSLTTQSLETWSTGEARKDVYDRAQVVLDALAADLRNTYVENEIYDNGSRIMTPPIFACDLDKNRHPRLRFVRTGDPATMRAGAPPNPSRFIAPMYYTPAWEVAYVMDPEPGDAVLWRGVRSFDRGASGGLLKPTNYSSKSDQMWASFTPVETGILYVSYKFWTQFTTTWDDAVALQRQGGRSAQKSGPEKRWDSTRQDRSFFLHRKSADITNPDFVYPEIVEVSVTVEGSPPDQSGVKLAEGVDDRTNFLRLSHTRGIPDGPGLVKIENEWIEYAEKTLTDLVTLRRGQRGTKAEAHAVGTAVRFGETFTTEVRIPAYREAQEP